MKVLKYLLPITFISIYLISCGSTPVNNQNDSNFSVDSDNNESELINDSNDYDLADDTEDSYYVEEDEVETLEEPSEEEIFLFGLNDVSIEFTSVPKIANVNRAFSSNFSFTVTKDGTPASDYPVTISYPSARKLNDISYTEIQVITDENGSYTYKPATPDFAVAAKLSVYPTPINDSEELINAAKEHKTEADWKVRSNIISKGAVLFIWDFNEKDRPVNNSYDVLSEFRTRGMTMVGNAPVNETSYIGKSLTSLYKENYEIIEDAYGYLIVGTIKFTKPVAPCDDGYLCSLIADIQAVNMKNGAKVFESTFTNEATGANWNKCVTKCKEELAEKIVDALVYGL